MTQPVEYHEPARGYGSAIVLFALLAIGFLLDIALGGALVHAWGWLIAIVVVVGVDLVAIRAARSFRSLTITPTEVRVGEHSLPRTDVVGCERDVDATLPVLGQTMQHGLPRGVAGLTVTTADGSMVVLPTRRPERVVDVLGLSVRAPEIRIADGSDLLKLADIDQRAEWLFRVAGYELPEAVPEPPARGEAAVVFVAGRPPVGYARVEEVDGNAHLAELAVIPSRMRKGLGSGLVEAACTWAQQHGYPAITLTTFADVPWNAPFYAARGFTPTEGLTPTLAEIRRQEAAVGLDAVGRRIVMRRELTPPGS